MIELRGKVSGLAEMSSALNQLPSLLQQSGMAAMTESLELFSQVLRMEHLEGPYPEEIQSRTGSFRRTFRRGQPENIFRVQAQGTAILGTFGSEDKRARILNDGGIIKSSRAGGLLAVRSDFTRTAGGVVREKYRQPLRNLPHTFVRPIRARKAVAAVFERIGKRVVPIAWLVHEVLIKGRRFMQKTQTKVQPRIPPIFQARFQQVLDRMQQTLNRIRG